jgi:hypothetical protein
MMDIELTPEETFIHDIVNKLTMSQGRLNKILKKSDEFSKEEIIELVSKAKEDIDNSFKIIKIRKNEME